MNCRLRHFIILFAVFILSACAGKTGGTSGGGTSSLNLDQVSTIPLINNQAQNFYVYASNTGTSTLSNIEWSLDNENTVSNGSMLQKAKSKLSGLIHVKSSDESAISIVDTSECTSVAAGQSCRVKLRATRAGLYQLHAVSGSHKVTLLGGAGMVQADNYTPMNTGDPADTLTITPLSTISYAGGIGSGSFFVINNGNNSVNLDLVALQAGLPANASMLQGECPNPLPGGYACQIRVIITNPTNTSDQELNIPITLAGSVINSDNSTTVLPTQNGNSSISATSQVRGILQYANTQSVLIDNSFANVTTASVNGVISNTGAGSLTISSLVPNGDVLSISNDNCSSKTLGTGEMCSYTVNLDVTKITNSNNELISINYLDEPGGSSKEATSNVSWTYTAPLPSPDPQIRLALGNSNLNQVTTSTIFSITNSGNVALSNITAPTMNPANPRLVIGTGNLPCTGTLAVGSSCNYTVTYSPSAPSETSIVTLSGISATHPDNRGGTSTTTFNSSEGVNLTSTFAGILSSNSVVNLDENIDGGTVTFINDGNYTATLSQIELDNNSSTNLTITSGGSCSSGLTLNPGQSCNVNVSLANIVASGSGNGTVIVHYDNHNGDANATSSNSNISWLIGNAPSLAVTFVHPSLVTPVSLESSTLVILRNNGRDDLTNITIPTLTAPLAYTSGISNGCMTNGTQSLSIGESCSLILSYSPITAQATIAESLPSFSASYNNGSVVTYTTNPYSITLTGLSLGDLSFNPSAVTQTVNWAINTESTEVNVTNTGGIPITLASPSSNEAQITPSGCASGVLQPGESCTLSVIGNYTSSLSNKTVNGVITLNYSDATGVKSKALNVTGNYQARPVVTPGLIVSSETLFNEDITLGINKSRSYVVSLTNTTIATNNGLESISIPYTSLMPSAGGGVTYSINTDGINTTPCTLPSAGGNMVLSGNTTCNYHLVLNAGGSAMVNTPHRLSTEYSYHEYSDNSTTPTLTSAVAVDNSFNLEITSIAQLAIKTVDGQANNFDGIEQGLSPAPTLALEITNEGTGPVNGNVSADLPSGISGDFSSCNILAVDGICTVTLTMSTANTIAPANLNTRTISYNTGSSTTTASLPVINYSVVIPASPVISMVASVTNCAEGNGISSACMNNPDSMGGSASAMNVRLTFTNASTTTQATSLSLPVIESALFTTSGYSINSNTCNSGIAANGGTCVMEYNMPSSASSQAIQPDISEPNFNYNYTYTSAQGQSLSGSSNSNLNIDIDVVAPVMNIPVIESITAGESKAVTITLSSLYQTATPSVVVTPITGLNKPTFSVPACTAVSNNGSNCPFVITTESTTESGSYPVSASSINNLVTASRVFSVMPKTEVKLVIFVTSGTWNGNLGGFAGADAKCNADASKPSTPDGAPYKALLFGNDSTIAGKDYYRDDMSTRIATATGSDLVGEYGRPVNPITTTTRTVWTGADGVNNCNSWRSSSSSGMAGDSSLVRYWAYTIMGGICGKKYHLYCVQQPE